LSTSDPTVQLTFASYNIHKAVGLDRRRDPERTLSVIHELGADIVALQEVDRRFGSRESVLPRQAVEEHGWNIVPLRSRPASIGWHGNAILVRDGIEITDAEPVHLPRLEPRGAICAHLRVEGRSLYVVGMHLDLSGIRRLHQIEAVCAHLHGRKGPAVVLGDFNEWSPRSRCFRAFADGWTVLAPGRSFPSQRPLAQLDRIVHSPGWRCEEARVHHSALASLASDHLPVTARLVLTAA
jgi:endonuclease/exonuclease/phosphatase family metal-dependent hydrolase